jgi:quercetin dioxygenase-like cupin family protein
MGAKAKLNEGRRKAAAAGTAALDFPLPAWLKKAQPGGIPGRVPVRKGTKTPGAYRAGANGVYVLRFIDLQSREAGGTGKLGTRKPGDLYAADTRSVVIEGEKVMVALLHERAGMGSRPHSHPNDQFVFVLKGTLCVRIEGQPEMLVPAGSVAFFPGNVVHSTGATADGDVISFACKDLAAGFSGIPLDRSKSCPETSFAAVKRRRAGKTAR